MKRYFEKEVLVEYLRLSCVGVPQSFHRARASPGKCSSQVIGRRIVSKKATPRTRSGGGGQPSPVQAPPPPVVSDEYDVVEFHLVEPGVEVAGGVEEAIVDWRFA